MLEVEIICKANSLIINFTKELKMIYFEQKRSEEQAESLMFTSLDAFILFRYDFSILENEEWLLNWLRKIFKVKEVQIQLPQELRVFRESHLGVLYVVPDLPSSDFRDEFFKIAYLRNLNFGVPFMWMSYSQMLVQEAPENKSYASKNAF